MNIRLTLRIQGGLLIFLGLALLVPLLVSLLHPLPGSMHDGSLPAFAWSALIAIVAGAALFRAFPCNDEISYREGFGIVTIGWMAFAVFGALPYVFSGTIPNFINAFFESMSGFTTTGATVITDLAPVSKSILLWRSMTQWLGGMGIIVLSLAILPFLGVSGMQLFEAEVPGPTADRLSPRIQDTAKVLWGVYFLLTLVEVVLLRLGGMTLFEAVCHAFTTMATGGFSTENASVGAFNSNYIHIVIIVFMFLAGVNFSLHYYLLRGSFQRYWRSEEFRCYVGIVVGAALLITLLNRGLYASTGVNLRDALFQTVSLMTTTGYATADYELWSAMAQYTLVVLMFVGGCAGSTGGSMKVVRILLVGKQAILQLSRLIHPREVRLLKLDRKPVSREVMESVSGFVVLYFACFMVASMLMAMCGLDLVSAGASVIACLGNVGPGLGSVGPTDNFAHLPAFGKLTLSLCMLVGRLEIFTVFVLFFPSFWRK
jgi:trk system potassium uptake protein TrkH